MADTLAQNIFQGAMQTAQNAPSDALQAYHVTATAEHARQELDMQKQESAMNKAKWASSQLDNISRMEDGPAKNLMLDSFKQQMPQVFPNFNPDNIDLLKHKPELVPAAKQAMARYSGGQQLTPDDLDQLPAFWASHTADFNTAMEKSRQDTMGMMGQQAKAASMAQGQNGRVGAMQDNATRAAVQAIHSSPDVRNLVGQDFSLGKARGILSDPNHTPSWIELDESMQDAAKVLNGGTVSSDMKLKQLQASMFDKDTGHIAGYLSSNPDQPASPQSIAFANHFVNRLSGQIDGQLAQAAQRHAAGMKSQFYSNPNLGPAVADAIKSYKDGSWRGNSDIAAAQPAAQEAASAVPQGPPPGSIIKHRDGTRYKVGDDGKTLTEVK